MLHCHVVEEIHILLCTVGCAPCPERRKRFLFYVNMYALHILSDRLGFLACFKSFEDSGSS